jgi:hypothetical protein
MAGVWERWEDDTIGFEVPQGLSRSDRKLLASDFGMRPALESGLLRTQLLIADLMKRFWGVPGFGLLSIGFESSVFADIPHIYRLRPPTPTMIHIARLTNHPALSLMLHMSRKTTSNRLFRWE